MMAMAAPAGGAGGGAEPERGEEFDVILKAAGDRRLPSQGSPCRDWSWPQGSKDLVSAPNEVKTTLPKEEAEALRRSRGSGASRDQVTTWSSGWAVPRSGPATVSWSACRSNADTRELAIAPPSGYPWCSSTSRQIGERPWGLIREMGAHLVLSAFSSIEPPVSVCVNGI